MPVRQNGRVRDSSTRTHLRNETILKSEQDKVWTDELKAIIAYYC
jgi:hypothetical protein